jgi:FkbM family methyltransferase
MSESIVSKGIDLVDFDGFKIFMLEDDNLYRIAVTEERKHQDLETYQRAFLTQGHPKSPVTPANVDAVTSPRYGVFVVMNHLWKHGSDFVALDIGSHIGDWGLKAGNFVRTFGKSTKVVTFDPSEAGELVPYSIELNKLGNIVKHEMLAISDLDGFIIFRFRPGHLDSGQIAEDDTSPMALASTWLKRFSQLPFKRRIKAYFDLGLNGFRRLVRPRKEDESRTLLVRCADIVNYLERNNHRGDIFAKIDIEGHDPQVINRLLPLLSDRKIFLIFEYAPTRFSSLEEATLYLERLGEHFHIFDLYYCPNPTRFKWIPQPQVRSFAADVDQRELGYTDVFLLDKRTPACDELIKRLSSLVTEPDAVVL